MQSARAVQEQPPIHVAIVEDDPGFSDALSTVVQAVPDMWLAATAGTRAAGLAMLQGPPADVLLVDLGLPDGSGIDVIRAAAKQWPSCSIMVSTNFGDETHVMRSIEAGASGYLLKDRSPAKTIDEIRSLANGGSPISPIIARMVLARFGKAARATPALNRPSPRMRRRPCRRARRRSWSSSPRASPRTRSRGSWRCPISRSGPSCGASTAS